MEKFTVLKGLVAPLDRANVDTDQIIPKQFLKSIKRTGFGPNLFDEWRYLDEGYPGQDNSKRPLNPEFVLNFPRYQGAKVLLARQNFGCGSSREHAPLALAAGTTSRAVMAASFPLFCPAMFRALTIQGGVSMLAGLTLILVLVPPLLRRYGPQLRARSRRVQT